MRSATLCGNYSSPKKKQIDSRVAVGILIAVVAAIVAILALCAYVKEQNSPEKLIIGEWEAENYYGNTTEFMKFTSDSAVRKSSTLFNSRTWSYDYYEIEDNVLTLYKIDDDDVEYEFEFIDGNTLVLTDSYGDDLEFTRIGY